VKTLGGFIGILLLAGCSLPPPSYTWTRTDGALPVGLYLDREDCEFEVMDNRPDWGFFTRSAVYDWDDDFQACMTGKGWVLKSRESP